MNQAERKIGYTFKDERLLKNALTHSSYANEHRTQNNERLEFLGDSVLSIIISDYIFRRMRKVQEGDLSKFRATLVCEQSPYEISKKIDLSSEILLGRGEEITGGRNRPSVVSDAFEAVLAAIYLDGGMEAAREWLLPLMRDDIDEVLAGHKYSDYKTMLQEIVQKDGVGSVTYNTIEESGQDHNKRFKVEAVVNGKSKSFGIGHSKKEAEQNAAKKALEAIRK